MVHREALHFQPPPPKDLKIIPLDLDEDSTAIIGQVRGDYPKPGPEVVITPTDETGRPTGPSVESEYEDVIGE